MRCLYLLGLRVRILQCPDSKSQFQSPSYISLWDIESTKIRKFFNLNSSLNPYKILKPRFPILKNPGKIQSSWIKTYLPSSLNRSCVESKGEQKPSGESEKVTIKNWLIRSSGIFKYSLKEVLKRLRWTYKKTLRIMLESWSLLKLMRWEWSWVRMWWFWWKLSRLFIPGDNNEGLR